MGWSIHAEQAGLAVSGPNDIHGHFWNCCAFNVFGKLVSSSEAGI